MKIYDLRLNDSNEIVYSAGTASDIKLESEANVDLSYIDVNSFYLASSAGAYFQIADTAYFDTNQVYLAGNSSVAIESPIVNIFTPDYRLFIGLTDAQKITINETDFIVKAPNGINYEDDYSASFTDRSLVDKEYVDKIIQNVKYRTTANLTATYNNGASGVGATLTATTNIVLPTVDGIVAGSQTVGDRILVANQTASIQNGIYTLTSKGVAGVSPWILTRATDADTSDKLYKKIIKVDLGTAFNSTTVINTNTTAIILGTTAITYIVEGGYIISTGLTLSNKTITLSPANNSIARAMLNNTVVGCSVIGRSVNSAGANADIVAGSDGQVLKRVGGVLGFNQLGFTDMPFQVLANTYSNAVTATATFTVTIGQTLANTTYKVTISPTNLLSSALFYINNKTTTTFDVVYTSALTGTVAFDWHLYK